MSRANVLQIKNIFYCSIFVILAIGIFFIFLAPEVLAVPLNGHCHIEPCDEGLVCETVPNGTHLCKGDLKYSPCDHDAPYDSDNYECRRGLSCEPNVSSMSDEYLCLDPKKGAEGDTCYRIAKEGEIADCRAIFSCARLDIMEQKGVCADPSQKTIPPQDLPDYAPADDICSSAPCHAGLECKMSVPAGEKICMNPNHPDSGTIGALCDPSIENLGCDSDKKLECSKVSGKAHSLCTGLAGGDGCFSAFNTAQASYKNMTGITDIDSLCADGMYCVKDDNPVDIGKQCGSAFPPCGDGYSCERIDLRCDYEHDECRLAAGAKCNGDNQCVSEARCKKHGILGQSVCAREVLKGIGQFCVSKAECQEGLECVLREVGNSVCADPDEPAEGQAGAWCNAVWRVCGQGRSCETLKRCFNSVSQINGISCTQQDECDRAYPGAGYNCSAPLNNKRCFNFNTNAEGILCADQDACDSAYPDEEYICVEPSVCMAGPGIYGCAEPMKNTAYINEINDRAKTEVDFCGKGAICSNNRCAFKEGELCKSNEECEDGTKCAEQGAEKKVCVKNDSKAGLGGECTTAEDCQKGLECKKSGDKKVCSLSGQPAPGTLGALCGDEYRLCNVNLVCEKPDTLLHSICVNEPGNKPGDESGCWTIFDKFEEYDNDFFTDKISSAKKCRQDAEPHAVGDKCGYLLPQCPLEYSCTAVDAVATENDLCKGAGICQNDVCKQVQGGACKDNSDCDTTGSLLCLPVNAKGNKVCADKNIKWLSLSCNISEVPQAEELVCYDDNKDNEGIWTVGYAGDSCKKDADCMAEGSVCTKGACIIPTEPVSNTLGSLCSNDGEPFPACNGELGFKCGKVQGKLEPNETLPKGADGICKAILGVSGCMEVIDNTSLTGYIQTLQLESADSLCLEEDAACFDHSDPSVIGLWRFNEEIWDGAPGEVKDSSGKNLNGTRQGTPFTIAGGKINRAGEFNGTSDYIDAGNSQLFNVSAELTMALWAKRNGESGKVEGLIGKLADPNDTSGYALGIGANNKFFFEIRNISGNDVIYSDFQYVDDGWHHVAGVRRQGKNYLYVDGKEQSQKGSASLSINSESVLFGKHEKASADDFFKGNLDDIIVYLRGLSSDQVLAEYIRGKNEQELSLVSVCYKALGAHCKLSGQCDPAFSCFQPDGADFVPGDESKNICADPNKGFLGSACKNNSDCQEFYECSSHAQGDSGVCVLIGMAKLGDQCQTDDETEGAPFAGKEREHCEQGLLCIADFVGKACEQGVCPEPYRCSMQDVCVYGDQICVNINEPKPGTLGALCGKDFLPCKQGFKCASSIDGGEQICKAEFGKSGCHELYSQGSFYKNEVYEHSAYFSSVGVNSSSDLCAEGLSCFPSANTSGACISDLGFSRALGIGTGEKTADIINEAKRVIQIFLGFLSTVAVSMNVYAGILWASARGNEEIASKARKTLIAGAIGLVIIGIAWSITSFVFSIIYNI